MSWLKSILHSGNQKKTTLSATDKSNHLNNLQLKSPINIVATCEDEIAIYREFSYTPLPQRIFSKGVANLDAIGYLKRYYLTDGDTWLQCTYLDEDAIYPMETILFYWTAASPVENLEEAKKPLLCQQWLYNNEIYPRVWLTMGAGYQPQKFTEQITNSQESYHIDYQAMLFGKIINQPTSRYEYWLYSLEQDQQGKWQKTIAQGFSIRPTELIN